MTETIYTDEMIEACAMAARSAWDSMLPGRGLDWFATTEDVREHWREAARMALAGLPVSELSSAVVLAVARALGWPRKP